MKRLLSFSLLLALLVSMVGCQQEEPLPQGSPFYYCLVQADYAQNSTALSPEYRTDAEGMTLIEALTVYLGGPLSPALLSPFPQPMTVVSANQVDSTVYLTLSWELATLSGLELTLACSCLTLTTLALTGAEEVEISAVSGLLDGQRSIIMNKNTLLLVDSAA